MVVTIDDIKETRKIQTDKENLKMTAANYPDDESVDCKERFIQKIIIRGGEDGGDCKINAGDIHCYVEAKYNNGENSLKKFIENKQFERNYKYEVDEKYCRRNNITFCFHKSDKEYIYGHELIVNGVYLKSNKLNDFGRWINYFNGLTMDQFKTIIERYVFSDKVFLDANQFTYFYGQIEADGQFGIRPHKIFHPFVDDEGKLKYKSIANKFMTFNQLTKALETKSNEIKPLSFDDLYFDTNKLCYNCQHVDSNRKKIYQIYVNFGNFIYKLNESFYAEDFLDKNELNTKIMINLKATR